MRKIIIVSSVLMSLLVSCKKEKSEEVIPVEPEKKAKLSKECYLGVLKKDTISMILDLNGNQVSGELSYKFFEKDSNSGIINGEMKGDTLLADYTFMSEGKTSIRQVVFLKKGSTYTEGYGDSVDVNGKATFKNRKQVTFDSKTALAKVDCKM